MKKKEIKSPPGDYYYHIWNMARKISGQIRVLRKSSSAAISNLLASKLDIAALELLRKTLICPLIFRAIFQIW